MRENVLDVLMYLFETYMDNDIEDEPDRNEMRDEGQGSLVCCSPWGRKESDTTE